VLEDMFEAAINGFVGDEDLYPVSSDGEAHQILDGVTVILAIGKHGD
jgi:hypothetical protein